MKRPLVKVLVLVILIATTVLLFSMLRNKSLTGGIKAVLKENPKPLPKYGFNGNNTKGPAWTDEAFRDTVASLKLKIIRYPGGTIGDFWDWKKGWFIDNNQIDKVTSNTTILNKLTKFKNGKYSPTGLNELKVLVDQTKCEVIFTLNMVSEDLANQLDMLKQANSIGIPVKWVELGNEYNGKESAGRARFKSTKDYGSTCNEWIAAIKQLFPNVKVGVVGGDRQYDDDVRNWNNNVLLQASNADALVAHIYPKPTFIDDNGINFQGLYNEFSKNYEEQGFNKVKKDIWITEFNVLWSANSANMQGLDLNKYPRTWSNALAILLMTSEATDLPNSPGIILDHNIANASIFAAVETEKGTLQKLPNGIGFGAWCAACEDKTSLRQINFQQGSSFTKDYEIMGWQFIGVTGNKNLLVNFTEKPITIDVSALNVSGTYTSLYADKNAIVKGINDVHKLIKQVTNNTVELPAYSITTI